MIQSADIVLRSCFDEVTNLIESGRHEEALKRLLAIRLKEVADLTDSASSEYYYLHARCLYRRGDYEKALSRVRGALRLCRMGSNHILFASEKQLLGLICLADGRARDAVEAFTETFAARKRAHDWANVYSSLVNLALAHFAGGDMKQAKSVLCDALSYARKYNGAAEVRVCQLNRNLVALICGDFAEFRSILEAIRSEPLGVLDNAHVIKRLGQLAVFVLDHETARQNLKDALVVYTRSHIRREQAVCLEYLGWNEYFQGNYRKAKEYYQQVLAMPEPTASAVAQTLRMLTDVHVAEGDFTQAMETAIKAEAAITKINERIELGALYRAYGQIHEHQGDQVKAREYFGKSTNLLHQLGARYELALSYFACGRSECYSSEVRLEHLAQSKSLFVDMDVPKRVAQVKQAIGALKDDDSRPRGRHSNAPTEETPVIITRSAKMLQLLGLVRRLKDSDANVLITGETGTGKELLARYIHELSPRRGKPFRIVNCANLPETLVESLLFGCRKGVHSGSTTDQFGLIEAVDGGTFCFDEVGEIPEVVQAKLLRVLDKKRILPLGEKQERLIDVRFIAMTNRDVDEMIKSGSFRDDLCYRLRRIHFHIPPLRERPEDVQPLIERFLAMRGIDPAKIDRILLEQLTEELRGYTWGGNVREVENMVSLALSLSDSKDFSGFCAAFKSLMTELPALSKRERLLSVMERNDNNQTRAAQELGIAPSTFRDWLQKYGII